jgi:hypothetical protein
MAHDSRLPKLQPRIVSIAVAMMIAAITDAAMANEVMTDRCSGDVAFPSAYDLGPDQPGTMFVTRGRTSGIGWSGSIRQQIDGNGHIRWWCHSTTGNWADPGTWTVDSSGVTYNCDPDNNCTASVDASGHTVDVSGWTAERSRCDNHSNTFRARLGTNRLLQIECLGDTGQVSQRLVGPPQDISSGGFGNAPLPQTFVRAVQHAALKSWTGSYVYPRGSHLSDSQFQLAIGSARFPATTTVTRMMQSAFDVQISEKSTFPFNTSQRVAVANIAVRGQAPFNKDYVAQRVALGKKPEMTAHALHAPQTPPLHPIAPPAGNPSGGLRAGSAMSSAAHESATTHVSTSQAAAIRPTNYLEWADTIVVSPDVSLMLYVVGSKNQPLIGYAVRYIRRSGDHTLTDVMMLPPVDQPH